jgi:hypothetical protein
MLNFGALSFSNRFEMFFKIAFLFSWLLRSSIPPHGEQGAGLLSNAGPISKSDLGNNGLVILSLFVCFSIL